MRSELQVFRGGKSVEVNGATDTAWLTVPISDDKTATVTVFLEPEDCLRIAAELKQVGERGMRVRAAQLEPATA